MKTIVLLCILGVAVARAYPEVNPMEARTDVQTQLPQTTQTATVSQIPVYAQVETKVPHHEMKPVSHHFYQYPIPQYQLPVTQYTMPSYNQLPVTHQYPVSQYQYPIEAQVKQLYSQLFSLYKHFPYLFSEMEYEYPIDMHKGVRPYFQYPYYKQYEGLYDYPYYKHIGSQYSYPYAQYEYPKHIPYYPGYSQVLRTPVQEEFPVEHLV